MPVLQANVSLIQVAHAAGTRFSHSRFISPWCHLPLRSLRAALLPPLFILGLEMKKLFLSGSCMYYRWWESKSAYLPRLTIKSFDCHTEFNAGFLILAPEIMWLFPSSTDSGHIPQTDPRFSETKLSKSKFDSNSKLCLSNSTARCLWHFPEVTGWIRKLVMILRNFFLSKIEMLSFYRKVHTPFPLSVQLQPVVHLMEAWVLMHK